jgi:gliding motility-associated lipoprotein GldH
MFFSACDGNVVYEKNKPMEEGKWSVMDIVKFNVDISDVKQPYNYYLNVRIEDTYRFANLFLYMKTLFPDGKMSIDTIECYVADVDGRWLGERSGSMIDNRILLRQNVVFQQAGRYSFEFEQAMRDSILDGVADFGIRIEKAEP